MFLPPGKAAGTAIGPAKDPTIAPRTITKLKTKNILAKCQLLES